MDHGDQAVTVELAELGAGVAFRAPAPGPSLAPARQVFVAPGVAPGVPRILSSRKCWGLAPADPPRDTRDD